MAGVMTPSPNSSAAPAMTSTLTNAIRPFGALRYSLGKSVTRAMMPPSPRLSASINNATYLSEGHHQRQRPEQQGDDPVDVGRAHVQVRVVQALLERVERARAVVSEHHAQRAEHEASDGSGVGAGGSRLRVGFGGVDIGPEYPETGVRTRTPVST